MDARNRRRSDADCANHRKAALISNYLGLPQAAGSADVLGRRRTVSDDCAYVSEQQQRLPAQRTDSGSSPSAAGVARVSSAPVAMLGDSITGWQVHATELCRSVQCLDLSGCRAITSTGLEIVGAFAGLQYLNVAGALCAPVATLLGALAQFHACLIQRGAMVQAV